VLFEDRERLRILLVRILPREIMKLQVNTQMRSWQNRKSFNSESVLIFSDSREFFAQVYAKIGAQGMVYCQLVKNVKVFQKLLFEQASQNSFFPLYVVDLRLFDEEIA